jgi:D-sedoheptulose 7-phosphate isomerase
MNNVERIFSRSADAAHFAAEYLDYLSELFDKVDRQKIAAFIVELEDAYEHENTIFFVGNGGSAATASHMANDIGMDVLKKGGSKKAFRALALTENLSLLTAIANDNGYDNIFVNQLRIHYRSGDKLVAISASGNSPNVVAAAKWVKSMGGTVVGLIGFGGGKLKDICDVSVLIETPGGEYGPVEDMHMIIDHLIANWLQLKLQKENGIFEGQQVR